MSLARPVPETYSSSSKAESGSAERESSQLRALQPTTVQESAASDYDEPPYKSSAKSIEELYQGFQNRFRERLERFKKARPQNSQIYDECLKRYIIPNLNGVPATPIRCSAPQNQFLGIERKFEGSITYFLPGVEISSQNYPVESFWSSEDRNAYASMENHWKQEDGPLYRWINIPASNSSWIELAVKQMLLFYYKNGFVSKKVFNRQNWREQRHKPFGSVVHRNETPSKTPGKPTTLALFFPYVHWENSVAAAYMNHVVKDVEDNHQSYMEFARKDGKELEEVLRHLVGPSAPSDEILLRKYLPHAPPLYTRQTLDHFFYRSTVDSLEYRDIDQTISRYAESKGRVGKRFPEPPILTVNQCWMWMLGPDRQGISTLVTSFPTNWSHFDRQLPYCDKIDVVQSILEYVQNRASLEEVSSASALAELILERCMRFTPPSSAKALKGYFFFHQYEESLDSLLGRHLDSVQRFQNYRNNQARDSKQDTDFSEDFSMLQEVRDIAEELQMISKVKDNQGKAFEMLNKECAQVPINAHGRPVLAPFESMSTTDKWKINRYKILDLEDQAEKIDKKITNFLSLVQQRAAISEVHLLRELAQASERQGQTTFVFTVITMVFLPLTTLASFFGMNATELGSGTQPIGIIFAYIFPLSIAVIAIAMFAGFGDDLRSKWYDRRLQARQGRSR